MERAEIIYLIFLLFFGALTVSMLLVPYLAHGQDMDGAYELFAPTCHQKISRSLCLFKSGTAIWIDDCTEQRGVFIPGQLDRETVLVEKEGVYGYKMPVCSRDVGIYGAMLLGALAYPFISKIGSRKVPPVLYLALALVPIGLDGTLQLVSELGLLPSVYESTNLIRLLTGGIAGFVAALYSIPILVNMFSPPKDDPRAGEA